MSQSESGEMNAYGAGTSPASDLAFQTESLPAFSVGQPYVFDIEAVGGTPPYEFQLAQGSLPAGISLSSGGKLSGTPTDTAGTTAFIELSDAAGSHVTQAFDCQVA